MKRTIAMALASTALWPGLAFAQIDEATERAACMGDALRLCARAVPDRAAVARCMAQHHEELSTGCVHVFDAARRGAADTSTEAEGADDD